MAEGLQLLPAAALSPAVPWPRQGETKLAPGTPLDHLVYRAPAFDPARPLLIRAADAEAAGLARQSLQQIYPAGHRLRFLDRHGRTGEAAPADLPEFAYLYVPPAGPLEFPGRCETFRYIVARLRAPDGCPWDREQTHASLKPYLLEEAYETLEALEEDNALMLREELGDLLLQVLLHAQLAAESGQFDLDDVVEGISRKLIRRHPHVFGEVLVSGAGDVLRNWDAIKRQEKEDASAGAEGSKAKSILSGVPKVMPALAYAQAIQRRAARAGFDWPDVQGVMDKVREEVQELTDDADKEWELGDLLFALVNLARWLKVDAEEALRKANARFSRRFSWMEARCSELGLAMEGMSLAELDALWEAAKAVEAAS